MQDWIVSEEDRELFARELDAFVPARIFDAHVHWYRCRHFPDDNLPAVCRGGPDDATAAYFQDAMRALLPGRAIRALAFPFPHPQVDVAAANHWLAEQVTATPGARGQMLVTPQHTAEEVRVAVQEFGFVGLKCYHVFSDHTPTFQSPIEDFLPEHQVRVADELELCITLHIVRSRALADPVNQATLRAYCERYPRMRLILAHAARGFNPHHTLHGIAALQGLRNVWFDTSVVTDAGALEAIVQTMGHERLLYGSDFPVSHIRGRCVALGDSFFWISASNTQLAVPYADLQLSLVGLESLRTLLVAARSLRLSDRQCEDIFYNNAAALLDRAG